MSRYSAYLPLMAISKIIDKNLILAHRLEEKAVDVCHLGESMSAFFESVAANYRCACQSGRHQG